MKDLIQTQLDDLARQKEQVQAQLNTLAQQSDQAAAQLFTIAGAEEALQQLLKKLEEEETP